MGVINMNEIKDIRLEFPSNPFYIIEGEEQNTLVINSNEVITYREISKDIEIKDITFIPLEARNEPLMAPPAKCSTCNKESSE